MTAPEKKIYKKKNLHYKLNNHNNNNNNKNKNKNNKNKNNKLARDLTF